MSEDTCEALSNHLRNTLPPHLEINTPITLHGKNTYEVIFIVTSVGIELDYFDTLYESSVKPFFKQEYNVSTSRRIILNTEEGKVILYITTNTLSPMEEKPDYGIMSDNEEIRQPSPLPPTEKHLTKTQSNGWNLFIVIKILSVIGVAIMAYLLGSIQPEYLH